MPPIVNNSNNQNQPKYDNWDEMWKLLHSDELGTVLRVRLLQIAMDYVGSGSACIRAIEMLMGAGGEVVQDDLAGVPLDVLVEAKGKANAWVNELTRRIESLDSESGVRPFDPGEDKQDSGKPSPDRLL